MAHFLINKWLKFQLRNTENDQKQFSLQLTTLFNHSNARYDKSIASIEKMKHQVAETLQEITIVESLILDINELVTHLSAFKLNFNEEDLINIAPLLIEKVVVSNEYTNISLFLASLRNEAC